MKKITIVFMFLGLAASSIAQDFEKYRIGFKASPNVSWFLPNDKEIVSEGKKMRFGFGLIFDKHFTKNYAIGTGLNIFKCGGEIEYLQKSANPDTTQIYSVLRNYKMQYVEVPLTLKLRTNEIGYMTYWAQFGLGLGLNIAAKADETIEYKYQLDNDYLDDENVPFAALRDYNKDGAEEDKDVKDDVAIFRTSLIVGGGVEYSLSGNTSLVAGITFNNGFSDALKGSGINRIKENATDFGRDKDGYPNMFKLKSRTNFVELSVGILF